MSENHSHSEHLVEAMVEEVKNEAVEELAWNRWIALASVMLAVISALCGLGASMSSHEGARFRDEHTLAVAALSGKRAVVHVLESQKALLSAMNLPQDPQINYVIRDLEKESLEFEALATEAGETAKIEMHTNHLFEFASTFLGVAIGLCGLAILLRRKWVGTLGLVIGGGGAIFVSIAYLYRFSQDKATIINEFLPFL